MISSVKFIKIKEYLPKIFKLAAQHFFPAFLVFVLIAVIAGLLVFYKYGILPQRMEPEFGDETIKFKEETYQKIIQEWQNRGERFEAAKIKEYSDPFRP